MVSMIYLSTVFRKTKELDACTFSLGVFIFVFPQKSIVSSTLLAIRDSLSPRCFLVRHVVHAVVNCRRTRLIFMLSEATLHLFPKRSIRVLVLYLFFQEIVASFFKIENFQAVKASVNTFTLRHF